MRNQKSNNKAPLISPMHIALLLLCAVLLSSYALSGLYARYASTASGGDSARVAKFSFTENSASQTQIVSASLVPGGTEAITIKVENTGEVALRYVVSVKNQTNNIPLEYYIPSEPPTPFTNVDGTNEYIGHSGVIAPGTTVDFTWLLKWSSSDALALDRVGQIDYVQITFSVEQVD